jgi:hypothetical protein
MGTIHHVFLWIRPLDTMLSCIGILKQSMEVRVVIGLSYRPASLCLLVGRYDNPIPSRFLAPIDCSKIPAQGLNFRTIYAG